MNVILIFLIILFSNSSFALEDITLNNQASESFYEKNIPVRLFIWHFEKDKPIFKQSKDAKKRFDLEGLKQNILKKRYGHSALLIGQINENGSPKEDALYVSYPHTNDYMFDFTKYNLLNDDDFNTADELPNLSSKTSTVVELPAISVTDFYIFKKWYFYSKYTENKADEDFEIIKINKKLDLYNNLNRLTGIKRQKLASCNLKSNCIIHLIKETCSDNCLQVQEEASFLLEHYKFFHKKDDINRFKLSDHDNTFYNYQLEYSRKIISKYLTELPPNYLLEEVVDRYKGDPIKIFKNFGSKSSITVEFKLNLDRFIQAKEILSRTGNFPDDDFSFTKNNCSCATGDAMNILYGRNDLRRNGYILPPDPLDNMYRSSKLSEEGKANDNQFILQKQSKVLIGLLLTSSAMY